MKAGNIYLERYAYPIPYLNYKPHSDTGIIIVLPCHNEPDLVSSLEALRKCESPSPIEIIVVVNASASASEEVKDQNRKTYNDALAWNQLNQQANKNFHFILENELPKKHAGVGLARKIGMDEAVRMFESIGKSNGVILCFDADSTCEPNLLNEVWLHFQRQPDSPGCSINFEHPLAGEFDDSVYTAITYYELHLRYYVDALKYSGFPYAFHTIGSSMAVTSNAYQKQGGMNRRKAGEDFYFLHKIIPIGSYGEINTTTIFPSPRASDRVPFGTGRAVGEWLSGDKQEYSTYHFQTFEDLKIFMDQIDSYFDSDLVQTAERVSNLPESIKEFLNTVGFNVKLMEIKSQSTNINTFRKRFFQWFDGFRVLKYVHFARDHHYHNIPISEAVNWLFDHRQTNTPDDIKTKLIRLREIDKTGTF